MVEFALVVGLFVFIIYGLVSFGMDLAAKQKVTSAAADGARAAVGATDITTAASQATSVVQSKLGTTGYTPTYAAYTDALGCASPALCIKVTIVYNLPASPGLGLVVPPSTTASAVVRYK
jgi:Flp pilus assembly protein TadG